MFQDILDKERLALLPLFAQLKQRFYLAGGTALALQIGHRQSVDFDFFSEVEFDPAVLFRELEKSSAPRRFVNVRQEKNTLTLVADGSVSLSFFYYPYKLLVPGPEDANLRLAGIADIGCMKLAAIVGRKTNKDYVDLYYILQNMPLAELLKLSAKKLPSLDRNLILKSLVYFKDIPREPLVFLPGKEVAMEKVEEFLVNQVKDLTAI